MLKATPGEKPLLTVNTPVFWFDNEGQVHRDRARGVPTSRVNHWTEGMGWWAPWVDYGPPHLTLPGRNRFITGNFVFTLGRWNADVPQDPDQYYWGEELNLTVRSFTSGYDLWVPTEIVVWHMLHPKDPPRRHWEKGRNVVDAKNVVAFDRLRKLLYSAGSDDLGPYGLGTERTLHEYEIYAGFDFANKRAHPDVFTGRPTELGDDPERGGLGPLLHRGRGLRGQPREDGAAVTQVVPRRASSRAPCAAPRIKNSPLLR